MSSILDRRNAVALINEAMESGARLFGTCKEMVLCRCNYWRWLDEESEIKDDSRPDAERAKLIEVARPPKFASRPPSQIVPILANRGEHLASESSVRLSCGSIRCWKIAFFERRLLEKRANYLGN